MLKNLLNAVDPIASLLDMLKDSRVLFAIVITVFGLVLTATAKNFASVFARKKASSKDNITTAIKIVGLILIMIGLITLAVPSIRTLIEG